MKLSEIIEKLNLKVCTGAAHLDADVTAGYVSDMLSDVMGHAEEGSLWISVQKHQNIVAVAIMKSLAGIVLVKGREPEEEAVRKAEDEGVAILNTELSAFEVVGRLYEMGVRGK